MVLITCPECEATVSSESASCVHCGYPLASRAVRAASGPSKAGGTQQGHISSARVLSGVGAGILFLGIFVTSSAVDPDGPTIVITCSVGIAIALALYWLVRARHGHPFRWYHTLGLAVAGSLTALVFLFATWFPGDPEAMGFAVGAGFSYGLLLGSVASLLLYALRGATGVSTG